MKTVKKLRTKFLYGQLEKKFANLINTFPKHISFENVRSVLIVAPHADDEVIGCGGLIQLLKHNDNCRIEICFVTKEDSRSVSKPQLSNMGTDRRVEESKIAKNFLRYDRGHYLMINERILNSDNEAKLAFHENLTNLVLLTKPDIILVPNHFDMNPDHRSVCKETLELVDKLILNGFHCAEAILLYEIWGPVNATHYVELSKEMKKVKFKAMECYETQLQTVDYFGIMSKIEELRKCHEIDCEENISHFQKNRSREYFEFIRPESLSKYITEHFE